jgi:hypothetical protein
MIIENDSNHILWSLKSTGSIYKNLKTTEFSENIRNYTEVLYDSLRSRRLVDRHFIKDFGNSPVQRWWELFIGNWLASQFSESLIVHSEGPDFSFNCGDVKAWVECTAPWPSSPLQDIRNKSKNGAFTLDPDIFTAMVTGAMKEKVRKFYVDLRKKIVKKNDYKIIAINISTARDVDLMHSSDTQPIFRALLGLGPASINIPFNQEGKAKTDEIDVVQTFMDSIKSKNNSPIDTTRFLTPKYRRISGVLCSNQRYFECPDPTKPKMIFLHNPMALNPIPRGCFTGVDEYVVEDNILKKLSDLDSNKY